MRGLTPGRIILRTPSGSPTPPFEETPVDSVKIDVLPLRPAVRSDVPVTLDVLLRIMPPTPTVLPDRPALNLGLVLDRSGSMGGARKIDFARQAAIFAVEQ